MRTGKQFKRKIRQPLETVGIEVLNVLIPLLPRKATTLFSKGVARIMWYIPTREKHYALTNLNAVFNETKTNKEKRHILITSYATFCQTMIDIFWFSRNPQKRIPKYVHLNGEKSAIILEDKGFICITAHYGNWEIIGPTLSLQGIQLTGIAAAIKNKAVNKILNKRRQNTGQTIIERKGAIRKLLTTLRKNGKAAFVLDQHTSIRNGGIRVNFLGLPMTVSSAPALLAYRTGTEILIGFCSPQAGGHYHIDITNTITPPPYNKSANQDKIAQQLTQKIEDEISAFIRANPTYWLWSYKHWRGEVDGPLPEHYPQY